MQIELGPRGVRRALCLALIVMSLSTFWPSSVSAQAVYLENFSQAAPQGFGDLHNSMARASMWWNGRLYVGTSRDHACAQAAIIRLYNPLRPYPVPDTSISCTPNPQDLSLRAEIWRWTPDPDVPANPGTWDRVYQSMNTVPIPGTSKFTSTEIGFRDMELFTESDGTQALYATGISARSFIGATYDPVAKLYVPSLPPPTLLRTTDGVNWAPVPHDPGSTLGDLSIVEGITISSFNRIAAFNNRLYLIIGGDFGHGVLYEAVNPEQGNNAFQRVSPGAMTFTFMEVFQNRLYLAQGAQPVDSNPPYKIVKMDTSTSPYTFPTVVDGTRLPSWNTANGPKSVATMHAAGNALWVATNQPVELLRINPNDTWDLYIGQARQDTNLNWRYPRTGLGDSFDWFFNIHIHRMQAHDGFLYTATADLSNGYPLNTLASFNSLFESRYGFDVHRTANGWYFSPLTLQGFQEKDPGGTNNWNNFTGRVMNTTPYGLFIGTGNNQLGSQMWRATAGGSAVLPPQSLEAERTLTGVVLSWLPSPGATTYHVYKADYAYGFQLGVPFYAGGTTYPRPFTDIGTTAVTTFTDTGSLGLFSQYYVVAENANSAKSDASNLTRVPSLMPVTTFQSLQNDVNAWATNLELAPAVVTPVLAGLSAAKTQAISNNFAGAVATLNGIKTQLALSPPLLVKPWRADDGKVLLDKMMRRLTLAQLGLIPAWTVKY